MRTFFHEMFLLSENKKKELKFLKKSYILEFEFFFRLENSLVVEKDAVLAELTIEKFEEIIGGFIEDIIKKNEKSHEKKMMKLENPLKNESKKFNLSDFLFVKKLGQNKIIYLK